MTKKSSAITIGIGTIVLLLIFVTGLARYNVRYLGPAIPPYPNAIGRSSIPSRLEAQLIGEAFGGFETRDSYTTVQAYYEARLQEQGWEKRWYRNPAGICYILLIIENSPIYARTPPGVTSIAFKLRQAFYSELNTTAPKGCK